MEHIDQYPAWLPLLGLAGACAFFGGWMAIAAIGDWWIMRGVPKSDRS